MTFWLLSGSVPDGLGVVDGRLADCPSSPNCVCSDCGSKGQRIDALALRATGADVWQRVQDVVAAMPRTQIISASDDYLHAECTTALLGFVDDLELHFRPRQAEVAVRSASRVGYSDLGANRARVERLRRALRDEGLVR